MKANAFKKNVQQEEIQFRFHIVNNNNNKKSLWQHGSNYLIFSPATNLPLVEGYVLAPAELTWHAQCEPWWSSAQSPCGRWLSAEGPAGSVLALRSPFAGSVTSVGAHPAPLCSSEDKTAHVFLTCEAQELPGMLDWCQHSCKSHSSQSRTFMLLSLQCYSSVSVSSALMFYLYYESQWLDRKQAFMHFHWVYTIQINAKKCIGMWCRGSTDLPGSQSV